MPSAVPVLRLFDIDQAKIRLMHQRCGLKGLPRFLLRNLLCRKFAELFVNQRQKLLGGVGIALLDGGQDARDLTHDG